MTNEMRQELGGPACVKHMNVFPLSILSIERGVERGEWGAASASSKNWICWGYRQEDNIRD